MRFLDFDLDVKNIDRKYGVSLFEYNNETDLSGSGSGSGSGGGIPGSSMIGDILSELICPPSNDSCAETCEGQAKP